MLTIDEMKFINYKKNVCGSFMKLLYDAYFRADSENRKKLQSVYPELEVAYKYANIMGYWNDLVKRYDVTKTNENK
jgi:hypothetical protein